MGLSSPSLTKLLPSAFLTLTRLSPAKANERQKSMKSRLNQDVLESNIFQRVSVDLNSADPIEKNDDLKILNNDGLENLAGYICHKLGKDNPEICANSENCSSYTWMDHLSEGGLSKPTDMLMEKALQAVFDDLNGTDLHIHMCKLGPEALRFK
ncbi:uncharacterized protein LOC125779789 isoform X4 [Bactrocera dorsalis]|uniref:Uncharacterized protein LOC125779789 isoform X3 n=1 Tax=Bactrocera dorsalis TaxID=27457 RepID=A0ABM3K6C5_BACDO|nr:uncharacterized protein LOC125779789 isoform X3 [Bactrocera dorsalis]XP_049317036.1 uncharacterized protein LOC125779789 isoform X4 [Bactrocera dorsalis]